MAIQWAEFQDPINKIKIIVNTGATVPVTPGRVGLELFFLWLLEPVVLLYFLSV